jgi:hypothetical protein
MWGLIWFFVPQPDPAITEIQAKLSESETCEQSNLIGSAIKAAIAAQDLALHRSDPGLRRQYMLRPELPTDPIEIEAARLHALAQARIRRLADASTLNFEIKIIASSDIVFEENGIAIPISDWGKTRYLDPGSYVWTARLGTWEFFRTQQDVKARDTHALLTIVLPVDDPLPAPPSSQLAR